MLEFLGRVRPYLSDDSQLVRWTAGSLPYLSKRPERDRLRAEKEDPARIATVAEKFGLTDMHRSHRLRFGGMLLRAIEGEIGRGSAAAALHPLGERMRLAYRGWQGAAATLDHAHL